MTVIEALNVARVLAEVRDERERQHAKWGEQNPPDGTGPQRRQDIFALDPDLAKGRCAVAFQEGRGTWAHILAEEVAEALVESDPAKLRAELVQVAAVAVQWIEAIDRRTP